jgi:hypothetical protein
LSALAEDATPADDDAAPEPGSASSPAADAEESFPVESLMEMLRQAKVSELLVSTVSTLASVAYGKLELPDLPEAKSAIDAIGALLPLLAGQLDEGILRDFEQALASLRLAYADAVSRAE